MSRVHAVLGIAFYIRRIMLQIRRGTADFQDLGNFIAGE